MKIFTTKANVKNSTIKSLAVLSGWILLWWIISLIVNKEYLIPQPQVVALRLMELCRSARFWVQLAYSCASVFFGLMLALYLGFLLGALCYFIPILYTILKPIITIVTTTPVASFIILAIIWLPSKGIPSFIILLMVTPLILNNVYKGLTSTSLELLEMAFVYKLSFIKRWKGLYSPSLVPYFTAAIQTGIGFAWKAGIAAEIISLPRETIGAEIYKAKLYMESTDIFAWTIVVILLSFIFEKLSLMLLSVVTSQGKGAKDETLH